MAKQPQRAFQFYEMGAHAGYDIAQQNLAIWYALCELCCVSLLHSQLIPLLPFLVHLSAAIMKALVPITPPVLYPTHPLTHACRVCGGVCPNAGVPKNEEKWLFWRTRAAEQGYTEAAYRVGLGHSAARVKL